MPRLSKRSFSLAGHRTSVALEPEFWQVLGEIAGSLGLDADRFASDLAAEDVKQETWGDYATSQNAGVRGFPTLIVGQNPDGTYAMVTRGFQTAGPVMAIVDAWLAGR